MMMYRIFRIVVLAAMLVVTMAARAQWTGFDPDTPPEPGQRGVVVLKSRPERAATLSGGGDYTPGATAHISATRTSAVWKFEGWVSEAGDTVSRSSAVSMSVSTGVTRLTACYREDTDTLCVRIKFPEGAGWASGDGTYDNTETPFIRCYLRPGFNFVSWTRDGEVVSENRYFDYERRDGEKDVTLVANLEFAPVTPAEPDTARLRHTVYIQCDPDIGGTVNYPDGTTMLEGDEITLTASPAKDFVFRGWSRDGVSVSDDIEYVLRMGRSDAYMTACFEYAPDAPEEPIAPVQHTYTIYAGTVTVNPGLAAYMPVYFENTGEVDRLEFSLRMPSTFDIVADSTLTTLRTDGRDVSMTRRIEGDSTVVDVTIFGDTPFEYNNGAVVYLYLTAADTTRVGVYGDDFVTATGYLGTSIRRPTWRSGTIIVEKALPTDMLGDVNGDGRINIQDVVMLSGYIRGLRYDSFIRKNADINKDNRINIVDVALLVEIITRQM